MLHVETHAMSVFSAAAAGQLDVVCTLLDEGAKLDARDSDGRTALHHAAANGHAVVVQSLLERGARFDTFDEGNWSPLHSAAAAGRAEVVAYLIAAGTDIDASAASSGSTALVLAASKGRTDVVRVLLGKGANPLATDASGATALHRAAGKGELAIVELLLGALPAGTLIDVRDREGQTAFHVAAIHEQEGACVLLAEKGADLDTLNVAGESPKSLLKPSLRSQLGLADAEEEEADHTDWLSANYPVPQAKLPRPNDYGVGVGRRR